MKYAGLALLCAVALVGGTACVYSWWTNPKVVRELQSEPDGERARKVMILTLPSGKSLPVNYLREGDTVYAAADFPWWRELRDGPGKGSVFIRGESLPGTVRVVEDDPALREQIFGRLRPDAPLYFGMLIVIDLD